MEPAAKLITALAALIGALAWPAAVLSLVLIFRREIRGALAKIPSVIDRVKALKVGAVETELEKVADQLGSQTSESGAVSIAEVEAAAKIVLDAGVVGEPVLVDQLERLCIEYDTIRRVMPASDRRTHAMTRVFVQMRSLGPSISDRVDAYKSSRSAGRRLAAVAMMQMEPNKADMEWLVGRFREEHPFVFYHAALALQNVANDGTIDMLEAAKRAASEALSILGSFEGQPDASSVQVLEALVENRFSGFYS
ncbi:hypothetical protein [Sphingomonas sp.]|uniref:hypothetical protein n=1 Tax=Sphingomonas sp. TaxID=28214 RepID=UPI003AFF9620